MKITSSLKGIAITNLSNFKIIILGSLQHENNYIYSLVVMDVKHAFLAKLEAPNVMMVH